MKNVWGNFRFPIKNVVVLLLLSVEFHYFNTRSVVFVFVRKLLLDAQNSFPAELFNNTAGRSLLSKSYIEVHLIRLNIHLFQQ